MGWTASMETIGKELVNIHLPKDVWEDFSRYCGQHGMEPVHGLTQLLQEVLEQPFSPAEQDEAISDVTNDVSKQGDIAGSQGSGTDISGASQEGEQPWAGEKEDVPFSTNDKNLNTLSRNDDNIPDSQGQGIPPEESQASHLNDPNPNSFDTGNERVFAGKEVEINSSWVTSTQSSLVEIEHQPSAEEILQEIAEGDIDGDANDSGLTKPILEESFDNSLSQHAGVSQEESIDPISEFKDGQAGDQALVLEPYFEDRGKEQEEPGIEEIPEHIRQKVAVVTPLTQGNLQSSNPKMIDPFGKVPTIEQLMLRRRR